jgi:hypothetical protein
VQDLLVHGPCRICVVGVDGEPHHDCPVPGWPAPVLIGCHMDSMPMLPDFLRAPDRAGLRRLWVPGPRLVRRFADLRTISLGTGLSCIADHSICSSEPICLVRECPLQTVSDRAIGHATGTTCLATSGPFVPKPGSILRVGPPYRHDS